MRMWESIAYLLGVLLLLKSMFPRMRATRRLLCVTVGLGVIAVVWLPRFTGSAGEVRFQSIFFVLNPITLTVPVLLLVYFGSRYLFKPSERVGSEIVFPTIIPRLEPLLGIVVLILLFLDRAFRDTNNLKPVALAIAVFAVLAMIAAPGDIACTHEGIEQNWWWGYSKAISWNQVVSVTSEGERINVEGVDGRRIHFTNLHRDAGAFMQQIAAHQASKRGE